MWETTFKQDHNQAIKHRADWFKPFWKTKKGHWKLIYPGIDEIEGLNCMLTVECLDCGAVIMRTAHHWLVNNNQFGCSNCFANRGVARKIRMLEAHGFGVLSTKVKGKYRIYTMKCPKCGLVFNQWGNNLGRWMKHGAKCPACSKSGKLPPDAVRIRKACIEAGITYLELGEKANYSESRVRNIANGLAYNEETAKRIGDIAEKIAKEKR
ncbi:multiprotein-bridging factor 1 family protein [Lactobacillus delbrueckii subsp. bulgaricus]|uniref:helix-turn-helix domain-containing protein n=1 Tax=Lactobacillus delbrueckii TaxID=1584 RepID=UPI003854867F